MDHSRLVQIRNLRTHSSPIYFPASTGFPVYRPLVAPLIIIDQA